MFKMVSTEGDPRTAKVIIVNDIASSQEVNLGKPFVGPSGWVFDECLRYVGIPRSACFIATLFPFSTKRARSDKANVYNEVGELLWSAKGAFSPLGQDCVSKLGQTISQCNATTIVAMGECALNALTAYKGIGKYRGSILECTLVGEKKVVPTFHPSNAMFDQFINRYVIRWDLSRAWKEKEFPELRLPPYKFNLRPTFDECINTLLWLRETKATFACDIEVARRQVSMICFNWSDYEGISIPYGAGNWSEDQEMQLWLATAELLEDKETTKLLHNCAFDVQFLFAMHNVLVDGRIEDTMLSHSVMYPDFLKGLAFLASLYTDQRYWKDMVSHKTDDIDKEDG